jgi:ribonuclease D
MEYVRTEPALAALGKALEAEPLIALDTEAAGYHRYHDRVSLLQLSTRSATWIVDPLALPDLGPLAPALSAERIEVVLHDADYDLRLLARDHGMSVRNLFDTKIAAQFTGEPSIGLAALLEKHLEVRLDKRFQRADWAKRPLTPDQIAYAAEDTRHLPELRDRLRQRLDDLGRRAWAEEEFALREAARWDTDPDTSLAFLRIKGARDLSPLQLAALRELHAWRDAEARDRDAAPFRVLTNDTLVSIARTLPTRPAELADAPGVAASTVGRWGTELLAAVRTARGLPESEHPVRPRGPRRPPPDPELDERVERLRKARDAAATEHELDRGFLMARQQLEEIARARPRDEAELAALPGVKRWQVAAMGVRLVEALSP